MAPRKAAATQTSPRKTAPRSKPASQESKTRSDVPVLEWISAGVGLVLTLLVVGAIAWEGVNRDPSPPSMRVVLERVTPTAAGYVAEIALTNQGGQPAAQVVVEGVLSVPNAAAESSEVTFDYVPDHSTRKGGLFFAADPRGGTVQLRAKGFVEP